MYNIYICICRQIGKVRMQCLLPHHRKRVLMIVCQVCFVMVGSNNATRPVPFRSFSVLAKADVGNTREPSDKVQVRKVSNDLCMAAWH